MIHFFESFAFLLVLLNPFLLVVYLVDLVQSMEKKSFNKVMLRAGVIATTVFCSFALLGDAIFSELVKAEFASFQIFGGIIFLMIGIQFVFKGPNALELLRGESEHLAGAIAMPVLIGPGTISASVIIGRNNHILLAILAIILAVLITILIIFFLKSLHDYVKPRNEPLIQRYIGIAGRITALFVGTVSIEMIMQGVRTWIGKF